GSEASLLKVKQLIVPRLDRSEGGYLFGLSLYDAERAQLTASVEERCGPTTSACTADKLREIVARCANQLRHELELGSPQASAEMVSVEPAPRNPALSHAKWA